MAATPRPDGLYDVTMDTGQTVPMNLSAEQLQGLGHEIMPPPGGPSQATAMGPAPAPGGVSDVPAPVPGIDPREAAVMAGQGPAGPMGAVTQRSMPPIAAAATEAPDPEFMGMKAKQAELSEKYRRGQILQSDYEKQKAEIDGKVAEQSPKPEPAKVDPLDLDMSGGGGGNAFRPTPVRRIPGGDVRASYTRRPGQELPEDIKSEFESDRRPEDYQARAQTIADLRDEQQTEREAHLMERRQALEVERSKRAEVDQKLGEKEKLISQREAEADKLTPRTAREVWNDKGTFGQLMAAVSVALGGYLQGSGRTASNQGLDQLNASIASDVSGERQKYEDALAKGKVAQNDYAKALELYGSPEAAEQDLTMRRLAIAEKIVENHGQAIGTQESLQAAQEKVGELRQRRAEVKKALFEHEHGQVIQENYVLTPDRYVGGTPQMKPDTLERAVRLPNGQFLFAVDKDTKKKAQEQIKVDNRIADSAERLRQLRDLPGAKTDPAIRGQIQAAAADLFISMKSGANLGTLDKGSLDFREEWTGDPTALVDLGGADAKLSEASRAARGRIQDTVRYDLHSDPNSLSPAAAARPRTRSNE